MQRRQALGGSLPKRAVGETSLELPGDDAYNEVFAGSGKVEASTTSAFTRLLRTLARTDGLR